MTSNLASRIANGRTDLVLERGATDNADLAELLRWCAYYGDASAVRFLQSRGARLADLGPDLGINAAAFHGHWQLCQLLLESSAPVDGVPGDTGETPLHAALCTDDRVRHDLVLKVLLAAGADANARTNVGAETGSFMRDCRTKGETPLHRAAAFGSTETIGLLLAAGAEREARDAAGDTPLSWASWHRRPAEILRLLCHGDFTVDPRYRSLRANLAGEP